MPNDPMNPVDSTATTSSNSLERIISEKHPKEVLFVIGALLIALIVWGVVQLNKQADQFTDVETSQPTAVSEELTQEEMIRRQLEALAAEDAANQVPMSEEEIKAQLEALAAEDATNQVPVSEEEIRAQLEALAAEDASGQAEVGEEESLEAQ
jgi:preprotein translocase subunit SecF